MIDPEKSPSPGADKAAEDESQPLTEEEQMAQYEESLKNDDWGHQPC